VSPSVLATVRTYDGFRGAALATLVAAGVASAAWLLFLVVRWFQWVPRLPRAGPETAELGGEPPAVANMLVHSWYVTAAAVPATVIDLAARRVIGLEEVGPERFVVRVHARANGADLTAYEDHVLRFVESRATGGSAPVDALSLGTEEGATWLAQFSGAVVRDAEARGLARRGWQRWELGALGAGLALLLGLFALALTLAHVGNTNGARGSHDRGGAWFALALVLWIVALTAAARMRAVRATPAGRAACSRWLGVRAHLRRDERFVDQPPASVAIWGRALAYGVALGANRASTAALPIGPDDPAHAWSREGGTWRRVRVRYPHRFGAGEAPRRVLLNGLGRLVLWLAAAAIVMSIVVTLLWRVSHDVVTHDSGLAVLAVFAAFIAVPTFMAVYVATRVLDGALRVWRGARDLRHTAVVEGSVVKVHDGAFAVDDGRASELVAMRAPTGGPAPRLGQHVLVQFTPALHHVEHLTIKESQDGLVQTATADVDHQG
jgi:Predicted membrane protein (DUF2207)